MWIKDVARLASVLANNPKYEGMQIIGVSPTVDGIIFYGEGQSVIVRYDEKIEG